MLLIPTFLAPSKIHGIGLFTSGDIKKGTIIWKFDHRVDQKFSKEEFTILTNFLSKKILTK